MSDPTPHEKLTAPWSQDTVDSLNKYQICGYFHEYTCANRGDARHPFGAFLRATTNGWVCPYCDYTQEWAHGSSVLMSKIENPFHA